MALQKLLDLFLVVQYLAGEVVIPELAFGPIVGKRPSAHVENIPKLPVRDVSPVIVIPA